MEKSSDISKLAQAIAAFQAECPTIKKDVTNTILKSTYASLENIISTVRPIMHKHGLVITQWPDDKNTLVTLLVHTPTGQYIQAAHHMIPEENTPMAIGAAITHQRRYGMQAILCLNVVDTLDEERLTPKPEFPNEKTEQKHTAAQADGVDDARPWITPQAFDKAMARIQKGEKGVADKAIAAFRMNQKLVTQMREAESKVKSKK